jgi:hypothetical protein
MRRALFIALAFAVLPSGTAHAQTPDRVRAMCGAGPVAWESLCNVDPGLHDSFILIEQIGGSPDFIVRNRLSAMIRDRHAAIDWHPNEALPSIHPGLLGLYDSSTRRVYVPRALGQEPLRVKTTILAHELTHAIWDVDDMGAGMDRARACVANEALAYRVGIILYPRLYAISGEGERPRSALDANLMRDVLDWLELSGGQRFTTEGLNQLTTRHLTRGGYVQRCARLRDAGAPADTPPPDEAPPSSDPDEEPPPSEE